MFEIEKHTIAKVKQWQNETKEGRKRETIMSIVESISAQHKSCQLFILSAIFHALTAKIQITAKHNITNY